MSKMEMYINPDLDHPDYTKCGTCYRTKIQSDVALEFIKNGREDIAEFFEEVELRWRGTDLFKAVQDMKASGLSLKQVEDIMAEKGVEI